MAGIGDEHQRRGGGDLPAPSANGSGPARNISPGGLPAGQAKLTTGIKLVRYGLPAAIILAGLIIVIVVPGSAGVEGAVTMFGICVCVALFNGLIRLGVSGDVDRDTEEAAREEYERTGVWPDERGRT